MKFKKYSLPVYLLDHFFTKLLISLRYYKNANWIFLTSFICLMFFQIFRLHRDVLKFWLSQTFGWELMHKALLIESLDQILLNLKPAISWWEKRSMNMNISTQSMWELLNKNYLSSGVNISVCKDILVWLLCNIYKCTTSIPLRGSRMTILYPMMGYSKITQKNIHWIIHIGWGVKILNDEFIFSFFLNYLNT